MEQRIIRTISLEPFKSRVPGSLYYIGENADGDTCVHIGNGMGNYNKLISDIEIPAEFISTIIAPTDIDINIPISGSPGEYYPIQPYSKRYISHFSSSDKYYYTKTTPVQYPNILLGSHDSGTTEISRLDIYEGTSGAIHKYLRYYTLWEWFTFFMQYYKELNVEVCKDGTHKKFNSFAELDAEYPEITQDIDDDHMAYMDALCNVRGGKAFFEWMCNKCFKLYRSPSGTSLPDFMYYDQISNEILWFEKYNEAYSGITSINECIERPDCCICQEYLNKGGYDTYQWLISIEAPEHDIETRDAEITIPIFLPISMENMGALSIFPKEWDKNETYNKRADGSYTTGALVLFEGRTYMLNSQGLMWNGISYSDRYREKLFGNLDPYTYNRDTGSYEWNPKSQWKWDDATEKFCGSDYDIPINMSGTCESSLVGLTDKIIAYDDMAQKLPGSLKVRAGGGLLTPVTKGYLDIRYHSGNVANMKEIGLWAADSSKTEYMGSIIVGMHFYIEDYSGNTIVSDNSTPFSPYFDIEGRLIIPAGSKPKPYVYCDVYYMDGATIIRDNAGHYYCPDVVYNTDGSVKVENMGEFTILKKETLQLQKAKTTYWLTKKKTYPIFYYKNMNEGTTITYYYTKTRYMSPSNNYGGIIWAPTYRSEVYLGISGKEKRQVDIYIDRGVHALYEKQLKLGEIASLDDFVQYGNGFYKIQNNK